MKRIVSFLLILCLVAGLSGCRVLDGIRGLFGGGEDPGAIESFRDMEYVRPDMEEHAQVLAQSCAIAEESDDLQEVLEAINDYYLVYDRIAASYSLADIYACADTTSTYWQQESAFCATAAVEADTGLESLYCTLAASSLVEELEESFGEGFFDYYRDMGEPDPVWQDYLEREAALTEEYAGLYSQLSYETFYGDEAAALPLAELLAELVALRQEMAQYLDYESYPAMAYELYHYRDYTPQQAEPYLLQIAEEMAQLYRETYYSYLWDSGYEDCAPVEVFSYVDSATQAMGGNIREAFEVMERMELYDITVSDRKLGTSFETYIYYYNYPYIFTCPYGIRSDCLDFAHEFGHFANDHALNPSMVGTDVAEVQSQGMEYMSLFYAESGPLLREYKLLDCLSTYVEQAAYAMFEQKIYSLTPEELTPENLRGLYLEVSETFGLDCQIECNGWEFVTVNHFYESPMYVISYVVSNDLAFQLYQKELAQEGAGLAIYEKCLESEESYLFTFADAYGLESPFAPGRLQSVRRTLEETLSK